MFLSNIQNSKKIFTLLDFSRIATLAQAIGLDIDHLEHQDHLKFITQHLMKYLSPEVSGVIVDPDFDFDTIAEKQNGTGLILSVEKKTDAVDPFSMPKIADNWGIEHIRNNYAVAKVELYYHPQEPEALRKKQFIAEVYDYCKYEGIHFLLELMVYHPASEEATQEILLEAQLQAAREFSNSCDLFALEYLGNALSAVTLTAELDKPWIFNARGVGYETFKQDLRVCMDSGAQGFLAGDPFWAGKHVSEVLTQLDNSEAQKEFIKTEIRDRIIEATRISQEHAAGLV